MKYLYSLLLIVISFQLHAQRNFKQGYIVTLNGDTIQGFINYREWNENPRSIIFKTTEQSATRQYTPANIKAFGVNPADHYQRYIGPITKGAVALSELSIGIDSSFVMDTVFLRVLAVGKNLTFFTYKDRLKTRYFIAEKSSAAVELKRYVYLDNNQPDKIREYNFYLQQLLVLAMKFQPDDKQLSEKINGSSYQLSQLQDIILQLNGQTNTYVTNTATRGGHRFFIGVGANLLKTSFFGNYNSGYASSIFTAATTVKSVVPTIAGGVDYYFNKDIRKLLFRAEANLSINKIDAKYSNSYWDGVRQVGREENVTVNQMMVSINPQLIYNIYNKNDFQFYLAGGMQLNFSSFTNKHFYGTNYFDGKLESSADKPLLYRKITNSLTVKTGVTLANSLDIYLGYYNPMPITDYPSYGIDMSSYRIGINYLFGKKNYK